MRTWPHLPSTAHLVLTPSMPAVSQLEQWCERLSASGFTSVRTNALGPAMVRCTSSAGFVPAQDLVLLVHDLVDVPPRGAPTTRRLPVAWRPAAAELDRTSFPDGWGLDLAGVGDVCDATPRHRARASLVDGRLVGYAVSGRDTRTAFLQRIAVAPSSRRSGHAGALVGDALRWARRAGSAEMYVNTPRDNHAALALYDGLGFRRLPEGLQVMERSLV